MSDHQEQDDDYGYQGDADRLSNDGDIDPSHSVTRDGGTLRVSVGSGERLKALAARDRAQAEGRVKTDSRAQVRTQVHSTEPAQAAPQAFRIVSSSGRVLPAAEVNAQSIIHIGEKTVEVGIAESVGLVERDGAGNLVLTKKGAIYGGLDDGDVPAEAATNEATNESTPDATKQLTTPESKAEDAAIDKASQAMNDVPGEIVTSVMARAVEGNVDVEEIARSLGVSAEEAEQRYSTISAGYEAEANSHLRGLGVKDADGFRAWAETPGRIEEFRAAVTSHLGGDLASYDTLAAKFASVDAALSQPGALDGFEGKHEIGGETATVYKVKGVTYLDHPTIGRMTLKRAVLLGHVERDD